MTGSFDFTKLAGFLIVVATPLAKRLFPSRARSSSPLLLPKRHLGLSVGVHRS